MAHYLVSMDLPGGAGPTGPLPSIERVVDFMRSTPLPSLESLLALKVRGKVVAGGFTSGREQSLMLIMGAGSEEAVVESLRSLPCWNEEVTPEVTRLHVLEELSSEYPVPRWGHRHGALGELRTISLLGRWGNIHLHRL